MYAYCVNHACGTAQQLQPRTTKVQVAGRHTLLCRCTRVCALALCELRASWRPALLALLWNGENESLGHVEQGNDGQQHECGRLKRIQRPILERPVHQVRRQVQNAQHGLKSTTGNVKRIRRHHRLHNGGVIEGGNAIWINATLGVMVT